MSLSGYSVRPSIAVSDMVVAKEFSEAKLGLSAAAEQADESRIYTCGGDTSSGVRFERYDDPALETDERGIHDLGDGSRVAWFRDPDGNTFAIEQAATP